MTKTKIIVTGARGRMGRSVIECAARNPSVQIVGEIDSSGNLRDVIAKGDVVIDFSSHIATEGIAGVCAEFKKALVIGTTGHSDESRKRIAGLGAHIPIVLASNFSTGVNTLFWLVRQAARILGPDYDLEIVEMHHRLKKDAPSGTARTLAEILAEERKLQIERAARHGREGIIGERSADEIGIHSMRGGDVIGDHTVVMAGAGERVELTHKATNRDTFANGAIRAALWATGQQPGLYDMQDVLGLK